MGVLDALPIDGTIAPGAVQALYVTLARLVRFAAFRRATESEADTWVDLLETSALGTPDGQVKAAAIGSWHAADVTDAVAFLAVPLQALDTLAALQRVLDLAVLTNQSVANLRAWTLADPTADDVTALKDAVRATLDPAAWRETMQSINDALRNQRRDALVAYILTHAPPTPDIDTADKLYEHFLVDVEMDACMQTSRIRLAISTVQLFVMRCLMNLEEQVSSSSIRADHWQWMKRYRVWEANRKIFLYPENWLEPELRDGKSSFFKELESELLKSDITDELAEDAYFQYLKKLDDVARLEIVGVHLQEGVPGKTEDDIVHVFGRTNGKTRQYYYRRFEAGYWTAWERIGLSIDGESVFPAIWKNQLYLFWVTAVEKPRAGSQINETDTMANQHWKPRSPIDVELTFSWGEYYKGKWISPKSTNMNKPLVIPGLLEFHPQELVLAVRTETPPDVSERLIVSAVYYHKGDVKAFKVIFTSKNCGPIVIVDDADAVLRLNVDFFYQQLFWARQPESTLDSTSLDVPRLDLTLRINQPENAWSPTIDETVFTKKLNHPGFNVRPAMHPTENQWEAPFFYADEHSTFYVRPDERVFDFGRIVDYVPIPFDPIVVEIPPLYEQVVIPNPRRSDLGSGLDPARQQEPHERDRRDGVVRARRGALRRPRIDGVGDDDEIQLPRLRHESRPEHQRRGTVGTRLESEARRRLRDRDALPPLRRHAHRAPQPRSGFTRFSTRAITPPSSAPWRRRCTRPGRTPPRRSRCTRSTSPTTARTRSTTGSCSSTHPCSSPRT